MRTLPNWMVPAHPDDAAAGRLRVRCNSSSTRAMSSRTVEVSDFVPLEDIDPIYYERTYWLGPDGPGAARAYGLLCAAMEDRQRVGVGSVVMRNKQYLAAIRPLEGVLAMSTLR